MPQHDYLTVAIDEHVFYRITCKVCYSKFDVRRVQAERLGITSGAAVHCIYCGGRSLVIAPDSDRTLWRDIAIERGMPDTDAAEELVHALWDAWEPAHGDPDYFVKYLDQVLAELNVPQRVGGSSGNSD